jgi:hypothetical protein
VSFSVLIAPPQPAYYQWQFNGVNIAGATNSSYIIASTDFINVGAYRVLVWGSPTNTSESAYLSVYEVNKLTGSTIVSVPGFYQATSGSGGGCPNSYVGFVRYTNTSVNPPSQWFARPTGTTQCTATDSTSSPATLQVFDTATQKWCANGVKTQTFPTQAPPTYKYKFTTFFTDGSNHPDPGQTLIINLNWF